MKTTRRSILQGAAPAVVYKVLPGLGAMPAMAAGDPLKMGFVGIGIRGMFLLEQFQRLGMKPVIAADVYDGHLVRAKEVTKGAIETTRDYRMVLERKDLDAVVIATPDHWHKQMTLEALSAGKHVYLEKPMCWSIEQNLEVVKAVEAAKKVLQVGSGAGTSAVTAKAKELIASGAIGKANHVRMENNRNSAEGAWVYAVPPDASEKTIDWGRFLGPAPKKGFDANVFFRWRCWWEYSGGVATDLFVHMLTQLHEAMGVAAPKSVVAQGGIYRWKDGRTVPDLLNAVYDYGGFLADLSVNLGNSQGARGMMIYGSEGTLHLTMRGVTHYTEPEQRDVQRYSTGSWPEAMQKAYFEAKGGLGRPAAAVKPKEVAVERGVGHQELFVRAVRGEVKSKEDVWQGHAAAGAAHLANQAFLKGRRLQWDWKTGVVS